MCRLVGNEMVVTLPAVTEKGMDTPAPGTSTNPVVLESPVMNKLRLLGVE